MAQPAADATARAIDPTEFAALAARYQEMAFGYALSILRDYHLAQDVTQEALYSAYRGLDAIKDARAFPAWLRGIVRHQCGRVLRGRRFDLVPLDEGLGVAAAGPGPEQHLEISEGFHRVLAAIRALPAAQREAAMLFYVKDYSHREIAAFLELPATTVNNRLHAARKALKERLIMVGKKTGRVIGIQGPVVEVRFAPEDMPLMLSALAIDGEASGSGTTLQVVERVGDGLVRCLARPSQTGPSTGAASRSGLAVGAAVVDTDGPLLAPLDAPLLSEALPLLDANAAGNGRMAGRDAGRPELLETGIKAIDLLCPYARGGTAGFFGPSGTGRIVVSAEALRNVARDAGGVTIVAFLHGEAEARGWYDNPDEVPCPEGAGRLICLPIDDAVDMAFPAVLAASALLDARICLSFALGKSGIWPAIDPLLSTSRLMDPAIIGHDHYEAAQGVRRLLRRYRELQESGQDGRPHALTDEDRVLVARARKVQRFFSQPFVVAEPFTRRPGRYVPLSETVRSFKALLEGAYDDLPDEAFMMRGSIDEVAS